MINSISQIEAKGINAFGDITKRKSASDYWLTGKNYDGENDNGDNSKNNLKIKIITPEQARKTHNLRTIGLSIAGATVLTAAGLFFLLKGLPKGFYDSFRRFRNFLENTVQKSRLKNSADTRFSKISGQIVEKLDYVLQKIDIVNNFNNLKDTVFKKFMFKSKTGEKIHEGITNRFKKFARSTVGGSYRKTSAKISEARIRIGNINKTFSMQNPDKIVEINGVSKSRKEWFEEIDKMNDSLADIYEEHFNTGKITKRYEDIQKKIMEPLKNKYENASAFCTKDFWHKFMSEAEISKGKAGIQKEVKGYRHKFSYSYKDLGSEANAKIIELARSVSADDKEKIELLQTLKKNIAQMTRTGDAKLKGDIINDLNKLEAEIKKSSANKNMDENVGNTLSKGVEELKNLFTNFKQGKVEDILDKYRPLLSSEEFAQIEKIYGKNVKSLDKSIKIETEDFISKSRDLSLGSAPTDILTMLGSLCTLGYYLGKSDNGEQRASISLKYGIPALAGIGTIIYCNGRLFAGTKSLLIGAASSLIVNRIGTLADILFKKSRRRKEQALQNQTFSA